MRRTDYIKSELQSESNRLFFNSWNRNGLKAESISPSHLSVERRTLGHTVKIRNSGKDSKIRINGMPKRIEGKEPLSVIDPNSDNKISQWMSHLTDWSLEILEVLTNEYPNAINADNFSICALACWNFGLETSDQYFDNYYDVGSEKLITCPAEIRNYKSVARFYYDSVVISSKTRR